MDSPRGRKLARSDSEGTSESSDRRETGKSAMNGSQRRVGAHEAT